MKDYLFKVEVMNRKTGEVSHLYNVTSITAVENNLIQVGIESKHYGYYTEVFSSKKDIVSIIDMMDFDEEIDSMLALGDGDYHLPK